MNARGPLVREELCEILDKPRSTVFDNLLLLIQQGYVKSFSQKAENQGKGRPPVFFQITKKGEEWVQANPKEN